MPYASLFVYKSSAGNGPGFGANKRSYPGAAPAHPVHYLEDNPDVFVKISSLYREVFGENLTLDTIRENVILRIGDPPLSLQELRYDSTVQVRIQAMQDLDKLFKVDEQGSGILSFLNTLLTVSSAAYPIVLLDEPEAFLHPPQAVKLGRMLGELASSAGVQVILATHDKNILLGLLQSDVELAVVRLVRRRNETRAHTLEPYRIKEVWSDPVLRYSNVLDGLFHGLVVLAENERDCTFYAAALDAAHQEADLALSPSDVLFIPTGGVDGQAPVVRTLASLRVPIVCCVDIDILRERAKLKNLIEALGGDWGDYEKEYGVCTNELNQPKGSALVANVVASIRSYLEELVRDQSTEKWSPEMKEQLLTLTRTEASKWDAIKDLGVVAFPQNLGGRPKEFIENLRSIGLVIVEQGELESFGRSYPGMPRKGPAWIRWALANRVHASENAIRHARNLVASYTSLVLE